MAVIASPTLEAPRPVAVNEASPFESVVTLTKPTYRSPSGLPAASGPGLAKNSMRKVLFAELPREPITVVVVPAPAAVSTGADWRPLGACWGLFGSGLSVISPTQHPGLLL